MSKYNPLKSKKMKFARFGGLSSVNQLGYDPNTDDFHAPPAGRGFYCFVWPYYEFFLLGGQWTKSPYITGSKFTYVRDKTGKVIDDKHPEYVTLPAKHENKYWSTETKGWYDFMQNFPNLENTDWSVINDVWDKKYPAVAKYVLVVRPHPRIFEFDGILWSHLGDHLKPFQIISRNRSWVKSTVADYRGALEKEMHCARKFMASTMESCGAERDYKFASFFRKNPFWAYGRDHLECFVEKL